MKITLAAIQQKYFELETITAKRFTKYLTS